MTFGNTSRGCLGKNIPVDNSSVGSCMTVKRMRTYYVIVTYARLSLYLSSRVFSLFYKKKLLRKDVVCMKHCELSPASTFDRCPSFLSLIRIHIVVCTHTFVETAAATAVAVSRCTVLRNRR